MTNEELDKHVTTILDAVYEADGNTVNVLQAKKYICSFYKGHVNCKGCKKPDDRVEQCTTEYTERITARPATQWSPEWDKPLTRDKVKVFGVDDSNKHNTIEFGLVCDRCYMSQQCPQYAQTAACSIDFSSGLHELKPEKAIDVVIRIQDERVQRARMIEIADGGVPDMNMSAEVDRLRDLISLKADMESDKFSLKIEATAKNNGGSILSQFFGGGMKQPQLEQPQALSPVEDAVFEIEEPPTKVPEYVTNKSKETPRKTPTKVRTPKR